MARGLKKNDPSKLTSRELVARFEKLVLDQEIELLALETKAYNRLYKIIAAIASELTSRDGDERHLLLPFLDHESPHLRYVTAMKCEDIDRIHARAVLREIADCKVTPYALHAGMSLWMMEREDRGEI